MLTPAQVREIRTAGLTDTYWAHKLRVRRGTIRDARRGVSYQHIPTPPDIAPREGTGRTRAINAGLPQPAQPLKQRRRWTWE